MKNLLALVGLAVVLVAGLGWYLGWYQIGTEPSASGHRKINVDVNTNKIKQDIKKGEEKVGEYVSKSNSQGGLSPIPPPTQLPALPAPPTPAAPTAGLTIRPDGSVNVSLPPLVPPGNTPGQ
jgi:hypothetical protein